MNVKVFNLISGVNKTKHLVHHQSCWCKWNYNECRCGCKELDDWDSCKNDCMWKSTTCDWQCNKVCEIDEYLDIKNVSSKKHLFFKLVLKCEDEILNTSETLLNNEKVTFEKSIFFILTISLIIICFLLLFVIFTIWRYEQ